MSESFSTWLRSAPICARSQVIGALLGMLCLWNASPVTFAQSVCLPAPRLMTTMPMGGQAGSELEITITGQHLDDAAELRFSDPHIKATPSLGTDGQVVPNKYVVSIDETCPPGIYEASLMTRLGLSASRVFSVGKLAEVTQAKPSTTVASAMPIQANSICNATMPARSVNHYSFTAKKGQRYVVDCAAKGIDSKLNAVLIVADADGNDLMVERRGGVIDFVAPEDGTHIIKVHELTFKGGPEYFYRLALTEADPGDRVQRLPSTQKVSAFSWPPVGSMPPNVLDEVEPNNRGDQSQPITLPCVINGRFSPAADVDLFTFAAKKGETWWVEVASERLGRPTDPSIIVQRVEGDGQDEKLTDIAELGDIPSPVKISSNGYAYDGPPYNAGSSDILGKIEIKEDGHYRIQLTDLFGGTRNDPDNIYKLVIRKATPDFALVAWAMHMELRNGDRNALSKPISLRGGSTMALEVVAVRRDGFNGDIDLVMQGLPDGVTAAGLKIAAGKSRGTMLITAAEGAPRGFSSAEFYGQATIDGKRESRRVHLASMAWPVTNAWSEIPSPRLLADVPVSVGGTELAPITVLPQQKKVWEASAGQKLTIPLVHMRRNEFSGKSISMRALGAGFEQLPKFDLPLTEDSSEAVIDLAKLKTPPGEYLVAFYGGAVAKYRDNPDAIEQANSRVAKAEELVTQLAGEAKRMADQVANAEGDEKVKIEAAIQTLAARQKAAAASVAAARKAVQAATKRAAPKDIVDIIVSEPITIRVNPAETK